MNKEEIIQLANTMGFILQYDKYDDKEYPGDSNNLRYLRFVCPNPLLDEKDLRWIWYKEDSDENNIERGQYILARLKHKKEIQEFLRY